MQQLTSNIAGNMLSIAGTIGISFVAILMAFKYAGEQKGFKSSLKVFGMTILIFTGLAICKDATANNSLFNTLFSIDKQVETEFVKINPVLGGESVSTTETVKDKNGNDVEQAMSPDSRMKSAGEMIASRVFYTNVYEPYLLMNYGTTNLEKIRKKKVKYKDTDYDRINILLDNDVISDENIELHDTVTAYEADELGNRTTMYFSNIANIIYGLFYFVVNFIQTVVYFILCFLRLIVAIMQVFLLPILPIILLVGLFMTQTNVFMNYFKVFGMTIFLKAMAGVACIFFATFLSMGFQLSNAVDNPWQKILTILIYLLAPIGLYIFRTFFKALVTGNVTLADAVGFATRPFSTEQRMRRGLKAQQKDRNQARKDAKQQRKEALKKRQLEAQKNGKADIGLRQQTPNTGEVKRSALRKELQQTPQHKAPNKAEQAKRSMANLHEKAQQEEVKQQQQVRQRQRKAYDKENNQTGKLLVATNKELGTERPLNQRRTGHSTKERDTSKQSSVRSQGQKQAPQKTKTNQRQATSPRSQRRLAGQKPQATTLQATNRNTMNRVSTRGSGVAPTRKQASVRQKMAGVQKIVDVQNKAKESVSTVDIPIAKTEPLTRSERRMNQSRTRRQTPKPQPQGQKGMRRPRAR